ncbi:DnaJ domain-containing protein [Reichenbachiella faecimaris]|uniref:DnaJ domain-containing protein n=1 Tax=Reichenbachiella faecimaris TaxID=692418 RepID=A0A1W2G5R2_REIFA|nr:KTSC domain-containing protein [Reichenbachiella faecimaris]SMD32000.1 DnaJ domain-containing protein [Reichenbachiella faecimaris]
MKRVKAYKQLFNVEADTDLKQLKSTYRNLVKEWHPDKFQDEVKKSEAEIKSQEIIDAYHFLVSIAPETKAANLDEYTKTTTESGIADFKHKGLLLEVSFTDGTTYEYFGVNRNLYLKFVNAEKQFRFAKRNIFNSFLYRKSKRDLEMA